MWCYIPNFGNNEIFLSLISPTLFTRPGCCFVGDNTVVTTFEKKKPLRPGGAGLVRLLYFYYYWTYKDILVISDIVTLLAYINTSTCIKSKYKNQIKQHGIKIWTKGIHTFLLWLFLTGKIWIPYIANDIFMLYFKDFPHSYKTDRSKLKEGKRNLSSIPVVHKDTTEDIKTNLPQIKTAVLKFYDGVNAHGKRAGAVSTDYLQK